MPKTYKCWSYRATFPSYLGFMLNTFLPVIDIKNPFPFYRFCLLMGFSLKTPIWNPFYKVIKSRIFSFSWALEGHSLKLASLCTLITQVVYLIFLETTDRIDFTTNYLSYNFMFWYKIESFKNSLLLWIFFVIFFTSFSFSR